MIQERNDIHQEEGEASQAIVRGLLRTRRSAKVGSLRENLTPVYRLKGWYHSLP